MLLQCNSGWKLERSAWTTRSFWQRGRRTPGGAIDERLSACLRRGGCGANAAWACRQQTTRLHVSVCCLNISRWEEQGSGQGSRSRGAGWGRGGLPHVSQRPVAPRFPRYLAPLARYRVPTRRGSGTMLHAAAAAGSIAVVQLLLRAGATTEVRQRESEVTFCLPTRSPHIST